MLGLEDKKKVESEFLREMHQYGFGKVRTLKDYWKCAGIDFSKKGKSGLEDWCNINLGSKKGKNDGYTKNKKFKGWNFKINGYIKIKKA